MCRDALVFSLSSPYFWPVMSSGSMCWVDWPVCQAFGQTRHRGTVHPQGHGCVARVLPQQVGSVRLP